MSNPIKKELNNMQQNEAPPSFKIIVNNDWLWIIFGSLLSFFCAVLIVFGGFNGFSDLFNTPLVYSDDALFNLWYIDRLNEGWYLNDLRNGYPFGSDFSDYPNSDSGSFLIIKILNYLFADSVAVFNAYYFLGFALAFISSFIVSRLLNLSVIFSFSAAIIFSFAPYHFDRVLHLFLTYYFTVPIYIYMAYNCFKHASNKSSGKSLSTYCVSGFGLIILSCFGIYYAFFGSMIILLSGIARAVNEKQIKIMYKPVFYVICLSVGVILNISPSIYNKVIDGPNPEAIQRAAYGAELYALKIHNVIAPRSGHRIDALNNYTSHYNSTTPILNENASASLGFIGTIGFVLILFHSFLNLAGGRKDDNELLRYYSILLISILLISTIGGFSSIFAYVVTASIRGWSRISVFISFITISYLYIIIQNYISNPSKNSTNKQLFASIIIPLVTILAVLDQTTVTSIENLNRNRSSLKMDKLFILEIEHKVKNGAAIYQLPYMPFPENPPIHKLGDYQLGIGFIHSNTLKWSYAGMKGREGDMFYRHLANEPIKKQLDVIKNLGFSGIYVDLRGYADGGKDIQTQLNALLGKPSIVHPLGHIVFYPVKGNNINFDGIQSIHQIMSIANFHADKNGKRYQAKLTDTLLFNQQGLPDYIKNIHGMSGAENWGRWSDSKDVIFEFFNPLPQDISIIFYGMPFGPNAGKKLKISIGNQQKEITLQPTDQEYRVNFSQLTGNVDKIEFSIPKPTSPSELVLGHDGRKLGFGFIFLRIEN